jgi:hypothetical protein
MDAIKFAEEQVAALLTAEQEVAAQVRQAFTTVGLDPNDPRAESWVKQYIDRCREILLRRDILAEGVVLEQNLRRLTLLQERRPSELKQIAVREGLHRQAAEWGWVSAESDGLLVVVDNDPSRVASLDWRRATLTDGTKISREELRESLRTPAYSNAGWAKHLASGFPAIRPPEGPR